MKKTLIGLLGSTVICVLSLAGCIDEHYGEKWENNQWINSQMNKWMFMLDDEIQLSESNFLCLHFPIEYHKITPGRYRISKSLWDDRNEIKLIAEFEIK